MTARLEENPPPIPLAGKRDLPVQPFSIPFLYLALAINECVNCTSYIILTSTFLLEKSRRREG